MKIKVPHIVKIILLAVLALLSIVFTFDATQRFLNSITDSKATCTIIEKDVENILNTIDNGIGEGRWETFNYQKNNIVNNNNYTYVIKNKGAVEFYNNNKYLFEIDDTIYNKPIGIKLKNIDIIYYKRKLLNNPRKEITVYIPIKNNYTVTTENIRNNFILHKIGQEEWRLTNKLGKTDLPINVRGNVVFGLDTNEGYAFSIFKNYRSEFLLILPLILFFVCMHALGMYLLKRNNLKLVIASLFAFVILFRLANYLLNFPINFTDYYLFSPEYFATDKVFRSLGDTIFNPILISYLCVIARLYISKIYKLHAKVYGIYFTIVFVFFATFLMFKLYVVAQQVVLSNKLPFGPFILENIDYDLVMGLLALGSLFFAIVNIVLLTVSLSFNYFKNNKVKHSIAIIIAIALFVITNFILDVHANKQFVIFVLGLLVLYALLLSPNTKSNINPFSTRLYTWVVASALTITAFIYMQQELILSNYYRTNSKALVPKRDIAKEYSLDNIAKKISQDAGLQKIINTQKLQQYASLDNYIKQKYFNSTQADANYKLYLVQNNALILGNTDKSLSDLQITFDASPKSISGGFTAIKKNDNGNDAYLLRVDLGIGNILFIEIANEKFTEIKNEPSFLEADAKKQSKQKENLVYKLFNNGKVVYKTKAFTEAPNISLPKQLDSIMDFNNNVYYAYNLEDKKAIIFCGKKMEPIKLFSLFGFVFAYFFIIVILALLVYSFVISKGNFLLFAKYIKLNLRIRVLSSQLFLQLITFAILIAAGAIYNRNSVRIKHKLLIEETNKNLEEVLVASKLVSDSQFNANAVFSSNVIAKLDSVKRFSHYNYNIFAENGKLVYSSLPRMFNENYVSNYAMPANLDKNPQNIIQQNDFINNYEYINSYHKLPDAVFGKPTYLQIPFFNTLQDSRNEFVLAMTNYLNIFVIIFLITTLLSYLISLFFSKSLTNLAHSVSMLNVTDNKSQGAIKWPYYDEVRILVDQYNKVEKQLKLSIEQLTEKERDSAWREMAKQVAHEIKNPITPIKLSLQNMLRRIEPIEPVLKEKLQVSIYSVLDQIDSLNNIASNFSEFAAVPNVNKQWVTINIELERQINLLRNNETQVQVNYNIPQEPIQLYIDREHLKRLITNLVINAIHAVQDVNGGLVQINCTVLENKQIVRITVKDNGIGISDAIKDKIFHANFTTKANGKGLGLAMCKDMVDQMGGFISFASANGLGTTFTVDIPINAASS